MVLVPSEKEILKEITYFPLRVPIFLFGYSQSSPFFSLLPSLLSSITHPSFNFYFVIYFRILFVEEGKKRELESRVETHRHIK